MYLEKEIVQWGIDRYILGPEAQGTRVGQAKKTIEEATEILAGIIKNDHDEIKDGIGDTYVTLCMQASLCGFTMDEIERVIFPSEANPSALGRAYNTLRHAVDILGTIAYLEQSTVQGVKTAATGCLVSLKAQASMSGYSFNECVDRAWAAIKDRKGRMVGGIFVKES